MWAAFGGRQDAVGVDLLLESVEERLPGRGGSGSTVVDGRPPGVGSDPAAHRCIRRGHAVTSTSSST
jgi:hypothetical protein